MSYSYHPGPYQQHPERRRSRLFSCLLALTILVLLLVVIAVAVLLFVRPQVSELAGTAIGSQLEQQLRDRIQAHIGEGQEIPADFSGEVVITDAQVNQYLAENPQEIAPLDSAQVQFTPGELMVDMSAYGASGRAYAGLSVENGRVVTVNPRIEGPLGYVLDAQQIATSLQQELNNQLMQGGKQVTAVSIQEGQIVATVAPN